MGCERPDRQAKRDPHSADARVAELAGRADGIVSLEELYALGLTKGAIGVRVARGGLHRLHRGVYAVGHKALTRRSHERAAVTACAPGAALSHQSAAAAWGLMRWSGPIHVSAPRGRRPHDGFVLHRTRKLMKQDVVTLDGLPVTTVHRTLVDLADVLSEKRLADAVHEAEVKRLFDLRRVRGAQARVPGRRGRHRLDRVLAAFSERPFTRSEAEELLRALCQEFDIPMPQFNATRCGHEIDALWPDAALGIEVDGHATHGTTRAFYEDRARDRALAVEAGLEIQRVTWRDLTTGPRALAGEIKALLRRR